MWSEGVEESGEFVDSEGGSESGGLKCGYGDAGLLQLFGKRAGISEADGVNVPVLCVQAVGDADKGFFGPAFVEFGDDHHEGVLGSVEW